MGAGVLYPREEHELTASSQAPSAGRANRLRRKASATPSPMRMKFSRPMRGCGSKLGGHAADVVVRIAVGVVKGQDLADHGPEQGDHRDQGAEAEGDEVAHPADGQRLVGPGEFCAADQKQQCVGKVVADHEVEIPPAGQNDRCRGQKEEGEPARLQLFKAVVQRQHQDGEGEDEAEPVRLGQHRAHPQKRKVSSTKSR